MLVVGAIAIQLIPCSASQIGVLSPETDRFLRAYALDYPFRAHPLSVQPRATAVALFAAGTLVVMLIGLSSALSNEDVILFVRTLSALGVVMALTGIIQRALWNGKIYGLWTPMNEGLSFGPFVNRNHFAGWMLMALPLSIGYFCARIARGMRNSKGRFRDRLIWFSSSDANESVLIAFAVLVMTIALIFTLSRSAIVSIVIIFIAGAGLIARRQVGRSKRRVAIAYLTFVLLAAIGWTGFDTVGNWISRAATRDYVIRRAVWADTLNIVRRFPLVGTGVDTYGVAMIFFQTAYPEDHYNEAHNDYLQLLAEGGALVTVPAALAALAIAAASQQRIRRISSERTDYWVRIGAFLGVIAIGIQELTDFSLQMPGNAVLFVVLIAVAIRPIGASGHQRA